MTVGARCPQGMVHEMANVDAAPGGCAGAENAGSGGGLVPAVALDAQSGLRPFLAETVHTLGDGSSGPLQEIVAIQDQSHGNALSGGQHSEARFVGDARGLRQNRRQRPPGPPTCGRLDADDYLEMYGQMAYTEIVTVNPSERGRPC